MYFCFLASSAFPLNPWGDNIIEPTPKLETGWANFDSSFGESMITNGDPIIEHELFSDVVEQSTEDIPPVFESPDITFSLIDNLPRKNFSQILFYLCINDEKLLI
jgi:hypothetical protein